MNKQKKNSEKTERLLRAKAYKAPGEVGKEVCSRETQMSVFFEANAPSMNRE